jgi:hypothetical protein
MAAVFVEARPKGRPQGSGITDYVVEDHVDHGPNLKVSNCRDRNAKTAPAWGSAEAAKPDEGAFGGEASHLPIS